MTPVYSTELSTIDWPALVARLVADHFHNGRTPDELRVSCERSYANQFARSPDDGSVIGMGRLLSDGVCNAYLVDVWTDSAYRRQGIGREIVRRLIDTVPGQHIALFTEHHEAFYAGLGFAREEVGMSQVNGVWLRRPAGEKEGPPDNAFRGTGAP